MTTWPSIDDIIRSQPRKTATHMPGPAGLDLLAGLAELRGVLDALPNSREELERIVTEARSLLETIESRLASERLTFTAEIEAQLHDAQRALAALVAAGKGTEAEVRAAKAEVKAAADALSARLGDVDGWVENAESRIAEAQQSVVEVEARLGEVLQAKVKDGVSTIALEVKDAEAKIDKALAQLREDTDTRFKRIPTMVSAPPTPTKVFQDGVLKGERRGINFVGATVTDGPERITVDLVDGLDGTYLSLADTTERVQDEIGALFAPDTGDLDWTYDDAGNAESVVIKASVLSAFIRTLLDDADAAAVRTTLGLDAAYPTVLAHGEATVTVVNTVVETTLASLALPTTLTAGTRINFRAGFDILNNSGGTVGYEIRVKLGASTLLVGTASCGTSASRRKGYLDVDLVVEGASAQRCTGLVGVSAASSSSLPIGSALVGPGYGTSTENLSSAKTLLLACTMDTANAASDIRLHHYEIRKVPA